MENEPEILPEPEIQNYSTNDEEDNTISTASMVGAIVILSAAFAAGACVGEFIAKSLVMKLQERKARRALGYEMPKND
jgi:hypothetical protein